MDTTMTYLDQSSGEDFCDLLCGVVGWFLEEILLDLLSSVLEVL
jgi:hypothetical protein